MLNKPRTEFELYPGMCNWLLSYLESKYKKSNCQIIVIDCHSSYLDSILIKYNVIQYYPQIIGLKIEIDVLGIVIWKDNAKLFFIEAKKTSLTLQNLGQLVIYCKLCNPEEAFLFSSFGLGSLDKVLKNLNREDLLDFGTGKRLKKIRVAKWDFIRNTVDQHTIVPKL
ncbi:hypothetical protein MXZ84_06005 [Streptococcus uberis]|nr:hypothetical protein [Streptococcus uberis]MCK1202225.1 hypothetical protein [Streptococcus uberis]